MKPKILLVDDDVALLETLALALSRRGFEVATCSDAERAEVEAEGCAVVVTDLRMPSVHGLSLARRLCSGPSAPAVLVLTAFGEMDDAIRALRLGVVDFLSKPISTDDLAAAIGRALRLGTRRVSDERPVLPQDVLVGGSEVMERLRQRIVRFGPLSGTVLVQGETGSGKERVAAALHAASRRAGGPFVPINCSALPENLAESELFGHVRGAFTDARADRAGLFREAHSGTLFLDEIGDLPAQLQPKLLRVLEARAVRPVGGAAEIPVDVRIVAATHRDLAELARQGLFREDLYYRLEELRIDVPPLRDREGDVQQLAEQFLAETVRREGLAVSEISEGAMDRLVQWTWPGNVRELRHVIYEAAVLCNGVRIEVSDLPARFRRPVSTAAPEGLSLDAIERAHIERVVASVGGNRTEAARLLGCDRKTLYRKLKEIERARSGAPFAVNPRALPPSGTSGTS